MTVDQSPKREITSPAEDIDALVLEISALIENAQKIRSWIPIIVYYKLRKIEKERSAKENVLGIDLKFFVLMTSAKAPLFRDGSVFGRGRDRGDITSLTSIEFSELLDRLHEVSWSLVAVLQVQQAYQTLGSIIERKYAYAFGFISLYIASALSIYELVFR